MEGGAVGRAGGTSCTVTVEKMAAATVFWRPLTRLAKIRLNMNTDSLQDACVLVCSRNSIGENATSVFLLALLACRRCVMLIGIPDKAKAVDDTC